MMSRTPQITLDKLRKLINEELVTVNETVDHASIRDIVNGASKLLAAIEEFKETVSPSGVNAVTPHIGELEKILDDMLSTPGSYVVKAKAEPKIVSLKPVKGK